VYGEPDIIAGNKCKKLESLGHVAIIEDNRRLKEYLKDALVEEEILVHPGSDDCTIKVKKRWRNKITEREVWAKIMWEDKALHGL
jgi:hypothetical protein